MKKLKFILAAAFVFTVSASLPVLALDQAAPVVTMGEIFSGMKDGSIWKGLLSGCVAGVVAAIMGWFKNRNTATGSQERFEIKYLIPTALVGALVGIGAALMKKAPSDFVSSIEASPILAAITMFVENGLKAVWRHGTLQIKDMLADVKAGAQNPTPPEPPKQ